MKRKESQKYITCKKCKGYYKLKDGESLADFKKCKCGGKLKYAESDYIPKKEIKKIKSTGKKPLKSFFVPLDITLVLLATILCIIFVLTPNLKESSIRTILGLLFILFLPGYSLITALFPKKDDLDNIERFALSFGLSIAFALVNLVLNYTVFGIRLIPTLISLSVITILLCTIAYIRRSKLPDEDKFSINFNYFHQIKDSFSKESKLDKILSIVLVISIILAISMTVYAVTTPKQGEKFTEFYLLGPNGKASDYPTNLTVSQSGNLIIGIVNHEYAKVNYRMVVKLNNQTIKEENITLADNEKYEKPFNFAASSTGNKQKLEFLLYKIPGNNTVYRSLHLWINVN